MSLRFEIKARMGLARLGVVHTPHGSFDTPAFMPVATAGAMKGLTPQQVRETGSQIILNNAYHLFLRPGHKRVEAFGGSHRFMRWDGPILTDSGGFQAFSMAQIRDINEDGVTFRSFIDGSRVHLGPESSMEVQNALGADIIMAFDDCPPAQGTLDDASYKSRVIEANDRTARWLERCIAAHKKPSDQSLFGIVQGGTDPDLRRRSVESICHFGLPGFAIGGVAVGETTASIRETVTLTAPLLPADKPRYLMGVGYERDIWSAVLAGVDMFDCVLPTRNGRNASVFSRTGPLRLRNAKYAEDHSVIDSDCDCEACAGGFSRGYIRHLFQAGEILGPVLASIHNIRHFQRLLLDIRAAIRDNLPLPFERRWPVVTQEACEGTEGAEIDPT
ncbi:MAG: tRNA guanosine(34) transglycosylase Tgt [Planctomycetota bacterium]|nr:tRNA guanosine(34) transglycosylase Tgt [Planctomycetota bacterium]